jgi:DNA-damage-inducible protein J
LCYNYIHKGGVKLATTKKKPIHVNVDENLKEEAEQLFDDLGLNMTSAITIFLKQSINNEQAIPFMINKGNKETLQALKDIKEGNVHGGFSSVEDLMEDLNA